MDGLLEWAERHNADVDIREEPDGSWVAAVWADDPDAPDRGYRGRGVTLRRAVSDLLGQLDDGDAYLSDYDTVRDRILERFNPPDDDAAEPSILCDAIDAAADYILLQPCGCTPSRVEDLDPCGRCRVLGRLGDKPVQR